MSGGSLSNDGTIGVTYLVDQFVQEALSLKITPFMLDVYAHEHEDFVRTRDAHMVETDELRNSVRQLTIKVYVSCPIRALHFLKADLPLPVKL